MVEGLASVQLIVSGRVQGVAFRASTCDTAEGLGLTGWVKNLPDGRVELSAEGPRPQLEQLVEWCRRGPPGARVDGVNVHWGQARGELRAFTIVR